MGRYVRELVRALVRVSRDARRDALDLRLFEVGGMQRTVDAAALGLDDWSGRRLAWRLPRRAVGLLARGGWSADRLLGGVELFHRVHADWPPVGGGARQVFAVSELPAPGSSAAAALRAAASRGAHALVFAETVRETVAAALVLPLHRVHAVPVGCDHSNWGGTEPRAEPRTGPGRLLVLGAARRSRQPLALLRVFEELARTGVDAELVFAGAAGDAGDELRAALDASSSRERVRWLPLEEERTPELLADADVLVHLSDGELTAVTPLEALRFGAAVFASRLDAFEEDLGGLATLVDEPGADPALAARSLADVLLAARDPEGRAARMRHAERFTWERNARATLDVWQRVLED